MPFEAGDEVLLFFDKFDEMDTVHGLFHWLIRNNIKLPIRPLSGPKKGQLDWRRPNICTLTNVLGHPIYAGAYSFGRQSSDPKRKLSSKKYQPRLPMEQWKILLKDRLPAYIIWERYLQNRERLKQNRNRFDCRGAPRSGVSLLAGLLICGMCGQRMRTLYPSRSARQHARRYALNSSMYDKFGLILRVETVINRPKEFSVFRTRKHRDDTTSPGYFPMNNDVGSLVHYQEQALACNRRYLDALSIVDDPAPACQQLRQLTEPKRVNERGSAGFNPARREDVRLFAAVLDGDHIARGFRNKDIRAA